VDVHNPYTIKAITFYFINGVTLLASILVTPPHMYGYILEANVLQIWEEKREQLISFLSKFFLHILTYIFLIVKLAIK